MVDYNVNRLVRNSDVASLRGLDRSELMNLMHLLGPSEFQKFIFLKNVKIFGGINGYVADFLPAISKLTFGDPGAEGALRILNKMLSYNDLSGESKRGIETAIRRLSTAAAAAA
jgi:hypothetical protein